MNGRKWIGLAAIAAIAAWGCSGDSPATDNTSNARGTNAADSGKELQIAVIPKGSTHDFWKHVHQGARRAGDELGVEILFQGPQVESDKTSQISMVETMVNKGVDGIVLAPLDFDALAKPVADAGTQNIPVVIIDSDLNSDKYISFVATDNEKGGALDAEEMIRLLNGKGRIAVLRYQKGSASTDLREKGFIDTIKAKAPGIQIVSDTQEAGPTRESALKGAENMLSKFRKGDGLDLDGIYCPNESSTFGMMQYLKDNRLGGKVKFVGFDAAPELIDGLREGIIHALVVQNPDKMGYEGVKAVVAYIKGENKQTKQRLDTGATLVTKANMDQPGVKELLEPAS
jgi:ribose transport system substrate-binding protein